MLSCYVIVICICSNINLGLWLLYKVGCVDFEIIPNSTSASAVSRPTGFRNDRSPGLDTNNIHLSCFNFQRSNNFC